MAYDVKCEELARHFLPPVTEERVVKELAQVLQDAAEDYLLDEARARSRQDDTQ